MKIKSLLIGSAAAVVAAPAAFAADIIIPEPEMVEYVRVCDAAGTGYWYIPGTETCLKISGYVQNEINLDDDDDGAGDDETLEWDWEARLQLDAWVDTQYGPLATVIRLTNDGDETDADPTATADFRVDRAYFDLAGLRIGIDASAWDYGFGGGADAYNNGGDPGGTIRYTAAINGFSLTASIEEDNEASDILPSVVLVAGFSVADIDAKIGFVYEDEAGPGSGGNDDAWGVKGTASTTFDMITLGVGFQYSADRFDTTYNTDYEWVVGGDVAFQATDALKLGLGVQYGINQSPGGTGSSATGSDDDWMFAATADYDITETLTTGLRFRWEDNDPADDRPEWGLRWRIKSSF